MSPTAFRSSVGQRVVTGTVNNVARVAILIVIVAIWQVFASRELMDRTVVSSPRDVAAALSEAMGSPLLWTNLWATIKASLIAFIFASVAGTLIGIVIALAPRTETIVSPFLSAANAMPRIALAPVFIVAFGLSIQSKIALAFTIVVFVLIEAGRAGVRAVDAEHVRLAEVLGASRSQRLLKVILPWSVPSIFAGLQLGLIYSLLGTVTAELMGSTDGIGQMLQQAAGVYATDQIYAILIVLAVVSAMISSAVHRLESHFLRWQTPSGKAEGK